MWFLLRYWQITIMALALVAAASFFLMWKGEVSDHASFRAKIDAEMQTIRKDNERKQIASQEVSKNAEKDYSRALSVVRADYDKRLRQYARGAGLSFVPAAPRSIDEIPSDGIPLAAQCAETTAQLIELQDWAREQHGIR